MSSTQATWFCHEVPDPACSNCNSSFVEKIEDTTDDDPRDFAQDGPDINAAYIAFDLISVFRFVQSSKAVRPSVVTFTSGNRTLRFGGPNTLNSPSDIPTMTDFLRRGPRPEEGQTMNGSLLASYMMSMLGLGPGGAAGGLNEMFARGFGDPGSGRMGDYVFNQEDLDEIITHLMENNNPYRPVPATEEILKELPREVLVVDSPLLSKDCAVCKEQFALQTEDPDEQVVVTLPCTHPFHEPCILPWLKSSGTCPVCRHQLVPQPEHHPNPPEQADRRPSPELARGAFPSMFQSVFGGSRSETSTSGSVRSFAPTPTTGFSPRLWRLWVKWRWSPSSSWRVGRLGLMQ
ncbi:hypothetical protein BDZ89DRAFT_1060182 [Hymenopellis radicata]|nr:hypothetical protein BDZ89DRAFT_1060182 [Hymenopellis radicata]